MSNASDVRRISGPFRVAAWVLLLGSAVLLFDLVTRILNLRLGSPTDALISGLAGVFGLLMFGYVALTGRSPTVLLLLEDSWNSRLGIEPSVRPAPRLQLLCWIVAVVIGTALIAAADANELFDAEVRGLVLLVYAVAAVSFVTLSWRFARLPPNKSLERTREG